MSYAVIWERVSGETRAGRLTLCDGWLLLDGVDGRLRVPLDQIGSVAVARGRSERLRGRSVVVVGLRGGGSLRIAALGAPGLLPELAERVGRCRRDAV